jgi:tetratricopeptide (TPR) repeat protein/S1-C subfamily serine protease
MKTAAFLITSLLLTQLPIHPVLAQATSPTRIAQADLTDGTLTPQQVQQTAKNITVRVTAENNGGSGVIIAQKGANYLILTNAHVVKRATKIEIQAPDGQKYQAKLFDGGFDAKYDLALLQFTSRAKYTLANLSNVSGSPLEPERTIYSAGFPFDSKNIRITSGQVSQLSDIPFNDGTQIGYVTNRGEKGIRQGMSGGAIFDAQGNLLGINTVGVAPILPDYTYNDGSKPIAKLKAQYARANWGIPIYNFLTNVKADILYGYDNLPKVEHQVTPTGYMARLNIKARQVTVRIENSSGNGSGVIVARQGSSYYVLTAKHVIQNPETKQIYTNPQIITYDQDRRGANGTVVAEGVDLAVVKFSSNTNYPLAQLGQYSPNNNDLAFVGGFPGRLNINSPLWQWQLNPGFVADREHGKINAQDNRSFSNGYDLIYSNVSYGGMSGGPVFDGEGKVIGIHGRVESTEKAILGQSLGISIQTFIELATRLQVNPQLLKIAKNTPRLLTQNDRKMVFAIMQNIPQPQENDSGERWLSYGNQLYRTSQHKMSVVAFEKAIAKGKVLTGYYGKALALWQLGKLDLARISIMKAIDSTPVAKRTSYYYFWKYQAFILSNLREYDRAVVSISTAIEIEPRDIILYRQKALILSKNKQFISAISIYDKLIRERPEASDYNDRGADKANSGDRKGAILDYDRAIHLNPNYAISYTGRGISKSELGDKKGAILDLNRAIQLNPNFADAYGARGLIKKVSGDIQGAILDYDRAIKINPRFAITYNNRGAAKENLGDRQGALLDYSSSIEIDPTFAQSYYNRALIKYKLGDKQSTISDLDLAIKINPSFADAYQARSAIKYIVLGNKQGAINDLTTASELFRQQKQMDSYQKAMKLLKTLQGS